MAKVMGKQTTRRRLAALQVLLIAATMILTPLAQAASGDFSIDFVAAAPQSYDHLTGGGAYDDRTIGTDDDVVESLEGGNFACGDIVTFFAAVTVADTASADADAPQTIELDFSFLLDTTGQSGVALGDIVGVSVNYSPIEDLIPGENAIDEGIRDDGGSTATLIDEQLNGTMFVDGTLTGTVELTDLERNEQVIVRIDVKLFCQPGSNPTGNLQADLSAARLTQINGDTPVTPPQAIPGGAQTIPFKQIGNMAGPAIDVQKTVTTADGTCPGVEMLTTAADVDVTVKYCYVVTNPSNITNPPGAPLYNVTLQDDNGTPADPADDFWVTLTGLTDEDGDGEADDLAAGGTATGSAPVTLHTEGTFVNSNVVNTATATGYDSILYPTPYTDTDIATVTVPPTAVELLSFEATAAHKTVILTWETASEIDNLGFNLYRATAVDGVRVKINAELIPTEVYPGSPFGAVYTYTDTGLKPKANYFYWLEDVDIYGTTQLSGPIEARATSGPGLKEAPSQTAVK